MWKIVDSGMPNVLQFMLYREVLAIIEAEALPK